jgi:hypothetical protein
MVHVQWPPPDNAARTSRVPQGSDATADTGAAADAAGTAATEGAGVLSDIGAASSAASRQTPTSTDLFERIDFPHEPHETLIRDPLTSRTT